MGYLRKQTYDSGSAPLKEGDSATRLYQYVVNNYGEIYNLLMDNGDYLENLNVSPSARIHEGKLTGATWNHPHYSDSNLGEGVIGDQQLQWFARGSGSTLGYRCGGVYLMRTFRPGMKAIWGLTQPFTARATDSMTYGAPLNVLLHVPFSSVDGQASPFSTGAVVQVVVTPQIPPGTSSVPAYEYFDGTDYLVVSSDHRGFDLWICTQYVDGKVYLFSYAAVGWEVL